MSEGAADVYLHIGRGKAGSSTIQSLADSHRKYMESVGVFCPLTLHGLSNNARLVAALKDPKTDRATLKRFRQDLADSPQPKLLVSAEAFHNLTPEGLGRLKARLGERRVHILFYVRDYPGWLPSVYAQSTKKAENLDDFDRFFERSRDKVSVVSRLGNWAEVFGWEAIRVRPLDRAHLAGGDLVRDVLEAMGVDAPPPPVARQNEAPHWVTLEVMRALAIRRVPTGRGQGGLDRRSIKAVRAVLEQAIGQAVGQAVGTEPRRAQYVTRAQWQDLAELYAADIEVLGRRMGRNFASALVPPAQERPFLPGFDAVSPEIRERLRAGLEGSALRDRIDPVIAAALAELLSGGPGAG